MFKEKSIKVIANNKKAFHEYFIEESFEAGIVLKGTEVKSIRMGKVSLHEGWVSVSKDGEAYLEQVSIQPYSHGNIYNHEATTRRKLLLRKSQLIRLEEASSSKGYTLIPLKVYLKGSLVKVAIAIAKGKKMYDKRTVEREKEDKRTMERALRSS